MNRRDFLKYLGIGTGVVATPKFIFDMGANLYKLPRPCNYDSWMAVEDIPSYSVVRIERGKIYLLDTKNLIYPANYRVAVAMSTMRTGEWTNIGALHFGGATPLRTVFT
jgi:hypothetical protein